MTTLSPELERQIEQGNEIIAKFMGQTLIHPNDRRWHKDWNCLMGVVEKIEQVLLIDYYTDDDKPGSPKVTIFGRCCDIHIRNAVEDALVEVTAAPSKIEAVHTATILFIRWLNAVTTNSTINERAK